MTVTTKVSKLYYNGDGVQDTFPYTFPIFLDGQIVVIYTDTNNVNTTWVLNTHYTITGAGESSGNVIIKPAYIPATGTRLTIYREVENTQLTDYVENDSFLAETHEDVVDKLCMVNQQQARKLERSLKIPESDENVITELPAATERASKYIACDVNGNFIAASATPGSVVVTPYMETVLDDVDYTTAGDTLRINEYLFDPTFEAQGDINIGNHSITSSGTTEITSSGVVTDAITSTDITAINVDATNIDTTNIGVDIITLAPQSTPASETDRGKVYGKEVSGKIELHYLDEDGNEVQITSVGVSGFPGGTKMYFYQDTAPTGWTYDNAITDKVLSVKGGSQAYNVGGGSTAGTWTQPNHTLSTAQIPAHHHTEVRVYTGTGASSWSTSGDGYKYGSTNTGNTGGGGAHNHGTTYRPFAAVGIICTKDGGEPPS